jgi:hypothetical protein
MGKLGKPDSKKRQSFIAAAIAAGVAAPRYSVYLLYWHSSTNTDAAGCALFSSLLFSSLLFSSLL